MKKSHTNTAKLAAIVLAMGLFAGCASTSEIQKAKDDAAAALRAAESAQAAADAASQKADQALQEAAAAKRAAAECTSKCDRMFQQSQAK